MEGNAVYCKHFMPVVVNNSRYIFSQIFFHDLFIKASLFFGEKTK